MPKQPRIRIVGQNNFLNDLLAAHLATEPEWTCETSSDLEQTLRAAREQGGGLRLLMVDNADSLSITTLFRHLSTERDPVSCATAIFNVDPEAADIFQAVQRGVNGVFYTTDSVGHFLLGIAALMKGEVWIRRQVLLEAASGRRVPAARIREESPVTLREMQILALVGTGVTNSEIADRLYISPHTVKTHLYNIYQKIGVKKRMQAALWAAQNLNGRYHHMLDSVKSESSRCEAAGA